MGIKKFRDTFEYHTVLNEDDFKGQTIAIDVSYEIHRAIKSTLKLTTMTDKDGNPTNYIKIILGVIRMFYLAGANQIWVFDNPKGNPFKLANDQRRAQRDAVVQKIEELKTKMTPLQYEDDQIFNKYKDDPMFAVPENSSHEISKLEKQTFRITQLIIDRIKKILDAFEIPYVEAPYGFEAEGLCAHLTRIGVADAVFTNDADALMFGAKKLIMRDSKNKGSYLQYNLSLLLDEYDWELIDFIHVGIMMGCDFYNDTAGRFKGLGPKKKIRLVKTFQEEGRFKEPDIALAIEQFTKPMEKYTIINEASLKNEKGSRPFRKCKKINELIHWLVVDLSFDAEKLVPLFQKTYKLKALHGPKLKDGKDKNINGGPRT